MTEESNFDYRRGLKIFFYVIRGVQINYRVHPGRRQDGHLSHGGAGVRGYVSRLHDGFGGLVVSMLASGTRVRGLKLGRSRWIFRASEKSSACLPSERK